MQDPVILLGAPRSFTSIAVAMLGQHPEMFGVPELNLFVADTMNERANVLYDRSFADDGLLRAIAQCKAGQQTFQTIMLAKRWLHARQNASCMSVFRELALFLSPRRIVEKSPLTVWKMEHMRRIHREMATAKYIHIVRNPKTQGDSIWRNWGYYGSARLEALDFSCHPPAVDLQKPWFRMNANIMTFLSGIPDRQNMRIRGEELLRYPDAVLTQIAAWLEISVDRGAIDRMKHPEASPFACVGPYNALFGNDPEFLRSPRLRAGSTITQDDLSGPVSWRTDGKSLSPEVRQMANDFGYK
jgi:hypothetical protein